MSVQTKYFASANTKNGFVSLFDDVFYSKDVEYTYIIKGGSGTGKSRLMNDIATRADGLGEHVEYFACSSDPDSLDGIILKERKAAIIDGTAPHVCEPRLPGVRDEILYLGSFWDDKILKKNKTRIEGIVSQKSKLYKKAYKYLHIAGEARDAYDFLVSPAVLSDKLERCANRVVSGLDAAAVPVHKVRLINSISYKGRSFCDLPFDDVNIRYFITGNGGIEHIILAAISAAAHRAGISTVTSLSPLDISRTDALYLPDHKIAFSKAPLKIENISDADVRYINSDRFICREVFASFRNKLRFLARSENDFVLSSCEVMKEIFDIHRELEKIYASAMDFGAKEVFSDKISDKIFNS